MNTSRQSQRVVLVTRPTWFQQLLARHGTRQQASFFLQTRDQSIEPIEQQHELFEQAWKRVLAAIPLSWRRSRIDRDDLDRFLFEPSDLVVAVGQDGLVANTAKYLDGQTVIGINPQPELYSGVLVPFRPESADELLITAFEGNGRYAERTMVAAHMDDEQRLLALNEIYVGHSTHQSARYELQWDNASELQSSSGIIVASGTGSTGWALSINLQRSEPLVLPAPTDERLVFFTREAWPSFTTGTSHTEGSIGPNERIVLTSRMNEGGVIFGDGIESDRIEFNWGRRVSIQLAEQKLRLMIGITDP